VRAAGQARRAPGSSRAFTILDPFYGVLPYHAFKPLINDFSDAAADDAAGSDFSE
jgi:hypothetical protein